MRPASIAPGRPALWRAARSLCLVVAMLSSAGVRADKTDVVYLMNGDRITGEVKSLERGKLEFSTDHMGTVYIEWEDIQEIVSSTGQAVELTIVGAVGLLQFDVMMHRLEHEYGAPCTLEKLPFRHPRWVTGPEREIRKLGESQDLSLLYDARNHPVILFRDEWRLRWALERAEGLGLTFHEAAP